MKLDTSGVCTAVDITVVCILLCLLQEGVTRCRGMGLARCAHLNPKPADTAAGLVAGATRYRAVTAKRVRTLCAQAGDVVRRSRSRLHSLTVPARCIGAAGGHLELGESFEDCAVREVGVLHQQSAQQTWQAQPHQ